jgi:hypothetical protein
MRNLQYEHENPARPAQDHISDTNPNSSGDARGNTPLKMEMLPVEALRPYANNARTHSKKQIRQIAMVTMPRSRRSAKSSPILPSSR